VFTLRPYRTEDAPFIHNSWLENTWFQFKKIPNAKNLMSTRINDIIAFSECLVCVDETDDRVIYGFVVYDIKVTHWVYVKSGLRRNGIATALLSAIPPEALKLHSHTTKAGGYIVQKYSSKLTPFIYEMKRIQNDSQG
jgi:L-amino acid N-acyltransferase YncA